MRRPFLALISTAIFSGLTQPVLATSYWHATNVKLIYPYSDASFVLAFTTDNAACTNAVSPKYYYVVVGTNGVTANLAKNILAVAMFAMSTEKQVSVLFDDATPYCYISAITVTN
jgi:hypothetical protein